MKKTMTGMVSHPYLTEEEWRVSNPKTIPGVLYISSDKNLLKIGNGQYWLDIDYMIQDTTPVGTIVFNIATSVPGFTRLDGTILSRTIYKKLFHLAVEEKIIIDEEDWQNDPTLQGYFSYSSETDTFRVPYITDQFLKASTTRSSGTYESGTVLSSDISKTKKFLYGIEVSSLDNIYRTLGLDTYKPIDKNTTVKSNSISGIVEQHTNGSIVGTVRPNNISYPLHIKSI